jgi:hypothetical protein
VAACRGRWFAVVCGGMHSYALVSQAPSRKAGKWRGKACARVGAFLSGLKLICPSCLINHKQC